MFVTSAYAQETAPAQPVAEPHGDAAAHTEVPGGEAHGIFPPFDTTHYASQLLWLAITFGLFYLFLKNVVLPRIGGILEVRSDRIAQDLDQAARMKEESDAAVAAYEQELAEARTKAHGIAQQARDNAKAEADASRKTVESGLAARLTEAEARIASIKSSAMQEVGAIAEETSAAIVQALVGGNVDRASIADAVKSVRG